MEKAIWPYGKNTLNMWKLLLGIFLILNQH